MILWDKIDRYTRRLFTGTPSSVTPDAHAAWLNEQVRAYATPQPYASPLSGTDNLTGETAEMREAYRRILKEPAVYSQLAARTFAVCSRTPQVLPDDKADPTHKAAARWVDWAVRRSKGGWVHLLMAMAFPGQFDGFSLTEKVFGVVGPDESAEYAGFWTLRAAKSKDTKYVRFKLDTFKNVVGVQAMAAGQGGRAFDPADFILFTHMGIFESPFGLSALRPAYRAANLIEAAVKLRSILLENFSGPYLVGKYVDGDKAAETQLRAVLQNARARGWITVPDGANVEVMNLATSAPDQFQGAIEDMRKEIALGIRGATLQSLESSSPQGDTSEHVGQTELFDWHLSVTLATTIREQLVPDLVGPNYGARGGRPDIMLGGTNTAAIVARAEKFQAAKALGLPFSKRQAYESLEVEPPEGPDDDATPPPPAVNPGPGAGGIGGPPVPGGAPRFADAAVSMRPVASLSVDPERFQFRSGHDDDGTVRDLPAARFDPAKCNPLSVWTDPADRRDYVIDGHHRFAWAERDGVKSVPVVYLAASSADEARRIGERINSARFADAAGVARFDWNESDHPRADDGKFGSGGGGKSGGGDGGSDTPPPHRQPDWGSLAHTPEAERDARAFSLAAAKSPVVAAAVSDLERMSAPTEMVTRREDKKRIASEIRSQVPAVASAIESRLRAAAPTAEQLAAAVGPKRAGRIDRVIKLAANDLAQSHAKAAIEELGTPAGVARFDPVKPSTVVGAIHDAIIESRIVPNDDDDRHSLDHPVVGLIERAMFGAESSFAARVGMHPDYSHPAAAGRGMPRAIAAFLYPEKHFSDQSRDPDGKFGSGSGKSDSDPDMDFGMFDVDAPPPDPRPRATREDHQAIRAKVEHAVARRGK